MSTDWRESAVCAQVDPEAFFPKKGQSIADVKRICMGCSVRIECLEDAIATDEQFGVRGGKSVRERRRLAQQSAPVEEIPHTVGDVA